MDRERVPAADLRIGDLVSVDGIWWAVDARTSGVAGVEIELKAVSDGRTLSLAVDTGDAVLRGEAAAVHHRDEFLGLARDEAEAWAAALGWPFRDLTGGGWFTSDHQGLLWSACARASGRAAGSRGGRRIVRAGLLSRRVCSAAVVDCLHSCIA